MFSTEARPQAIEKLRARVAGDLVQERQIRGGGKSNYIPHQVFSRILTDALGFRWSWEIINDELITIIEKKSGNPAPYVKVNGRLSIPGLGAWTAFGIQKLEDEESWKKADTNAFRKACDRAGIAYQTWDDGNLYHEDFAEEEHQAPAPQQSGKVNTPASTEPPAETTAPAPAKAGSGYSQAQIDHMVDIKKAYKINDNTTLLKLVKRWNPDYENLPRPDVIDDFIAWVRDNPDECDLALTE